MCRESEGRESVGDIEKKKKVGGETIHGEFDCEEGAQGRREGFSAAEGDGGSQLSGYNALKCQYTTYYIGLSFVWDVGVVVLGIMKPQSTGTHRGEKGESLRKVESRKRRQQSQTPEEQMCRGSSLGSDYHPKDVSRESDGSPSLIEEGDADLSCGEEMEGVEDSVMRARGYRLREKEDTIGITQQGMGLWLGKTRRLGFLHVEAIKEMTLKPILQYWSFGLRRELTLAFGGGGRVEFDGEEVGRMVRKHMAEVVATKKGKLFFPRALYGAMGCMKRYADNVQSLGDYAWAKVIPVLYPTKEEKDERFVKEFLDTDKWRYYLEDEEGVLSHNKQLRRARDKLQLEKENLNDALLLADNDTGLVAAEVPATEKHPVEVPTTDEHPVQVPPSQDDHEQPLKVLPVEQSTEEVPAIHVPSLEEPAVDVEHPTAEVSSFVDTVGGVLGDSLHFTADVHVTDTETSFTDDDGDNVQADDGNNEEPLREGAEQGQSERVEDQQPREGTKVGAGEVESAMEEGSGSLREEEAVVVSCSGTEGKPASTIRRGSTAASLGTGKEEEGKDVQGVGDIPAIQEVNPEMAAYDCHRSTELHASHTGASPLIVRQIAEALAHRQLVRIAKYRFHAWVGEDSTSNKAG
ncbi:hypothetical protein Cgig2_010379 [Carnegiea gigantea]|uniref:Uncharacterized protein n=1 Tax=Carnegiea gigantea TaxID=171969 RepID=A0A9Q1K907_9CARY|nr:hypothetical protein Cgig2_010379 [Carnegiea gigantea]